MVCQQLPFGVLLRRWRLRRRMTQTDLALAANSSTRHLSCLETGRSQPSRDMVLRLCEHLEVPLRDQNTLLLAAGFAPAYQERSLADLASAPHRDRPHPPGAYALSGVRAGSALERRSFQQCVAPVVRGLLARASAKARQCRSLATPSARHGTAHPEFCRMASPYDYRPETADRGRDWSPLSRLCWAR